MIKEASLQTYDRIVLDTAPVLAVSDSLLIAPHADATCLVLRSFKTPRKTFMSERSSRLDPTWIAGWRGWCFNFMPTGFGELLLLFREVPRRLRYEGRLRHVAKVAYGWSPPSERCHPERSVTPSKDLFVGTAATALATRQSNSVWTAWAFPTARTGRGREYPRGRPSTASHSAQDGQSFIAFLGWL